jgi:hypothetical protein
MSPDLKVQQMFDVKKLHVWLETFLKTMAPGTAKSYLSSLTIFIDFLVNRDLVKGIKQALQFKEDVKMFTYISKFYILDTHVAYSLLGLLKKVGP